VRRGASGGGRARTAVPASDSAERLLLAAFGALSLSAERIDGLADRLSELGGVRRDEARSALEELQARWRGDAVRLSERTGKTLERLFQELGLVSRREQEELELRVAQLEHRLRLVEGAQTAPAAPPR
jgi:polyhydroxyalkanoate synthesis regulator phasin